MAILFSCTGWFMSEKVGNRKDRLSLDEAHMSPVMRKPVFRVSNQVRHKPGCRRKKMARGLKFWIKEVEGLYYPCIENKGVDQLRNNRAADLHFFFAYAKSRFSLDKAHMSWVMRKLAFCICENKAADQLCSKRTADQRLCFHYIDRTTPLLPKSEI